MSRSAADFHHRKDGNEPFQVGCEQADTLQCFVALSESNADYPSKIGGFVGEVPG